MKLVSLLTFIFVRCLFVCKSGGARVTPTVLLYLNNPSSNSAGITNVA